MSPTGTTPPDCSDRELETIAEKLKALAQPQRLAIACLLAATPRSVNEMAALLGISQPNASRHLARMHARYLVNTEKEANRIYYRLNDRRLETIIRILRSIYCP